MKVTALMATCGRHFFCERSVGMFLNQTYENKHLLILQNSDIQQNLNNSYDNITLVNESGFTSLGEIYNRMLDFIPTDTDIVCFFDDDDIYLPNHIEEGVRGLLKGGKKAYKPKFSYFRNKKTISLINNTLEPSWFIKKEIILQERFRNITDRHHYNWIEWCLKNKELFVDPDGVKTLVYTWGNPECPVFKTSGYGSDPAAFSRYRTKSLDHGDFIITPQNNSDFAEIFTDIINYN